MVAADLPTEREESLSDFLIILDPSWTFEQIERHIGTFLAEPERLEQMAMDAFAFARRELTTTNKIDNVLRMAHNYRNGIRGYDSELFVILLYRS